MMISSTHNQNKPADFYFIAILILTFIFITVFSVLNIAKFRIFSTTSFGWVLPHMYKKLASFNNPLSLFILPEFNIVLLLAPVNYLIAFIYRILPYSEALLVFQTLIMASGAIPIYLLALMRLKHNYLAFAFSLAYLLHPVISTGALLGYIPLSLGLPFLLWAFYYLEKGNLHKFVFFIILANTTKIDVVLMNAIFGLILFFSKDKKEYGRAIFKISIIWLAISAVFCFFYLKFINKSFPIGLLHFDKYGDRPADVFKYAQNNLVLLFKNLFNEKNMLLSMLLFLPNSMAFFAPYFLLTVFPEIIYILIRNQHSSGHFPALAFILLSSIYGMDNLIHSAAFIPRPKGRGKITPLSVSTLRQTSGFSPRLYEGLIRFCTGLFNRANLKVYLPRIISFLIIAFALFSYYYILPKTDFTDRLGPLPFTAKFSPDFYKFSEHARIGGKIIKIIPEESSCLTLQSIGFHLGKCKNVGVFNKYFTALDFRWDYIFVDLFKDDFYQISKKDFFSKLKNFILNEGYGVMRFEDGWLLLKKGYTGGDERLVSGVIDNLLNDEK